MKKSTIDLELIRTHLAAIAARNGGILSPESVVSDASDPSSPLHDEFEWDDGAAGEMFRMLQANALIRRVKLTLVREDIKTKAISVTTVRAYQSRPSMRTRDGGGYEPIEAIMSDQEKRDELLASVLRELQAYRKRYGALAALSGVWDAIDAAVSEQQDVIVTNQTATEHRPAA